MNRTCLKVKGTPHDPAPMVKAAGVVKPRNVHPGLTRPSLTTCTVSVAPEDVSTGHEMSNPVREPATCCHDITDRQAYSGVIVTACGHRISTVPHAICHAHNTGRTGELCPRPGGVPGAVVGHGDHKSGVGRESSAVGKGPCQLRSAKRATVHGHSIDRHGLEVRGATACVLELRGDTGGETCTSGCAGAWKQRTTKVSFLTVYGRITGDAVSTDH